MLDSDIQAKEPERQRLAAAVAAFKKSGGKPQVIPSYQMSTYVPVWNNRIRAETEQHKSAKTAKREPRKPTRYELEMAEARESIRKINEMIEMVERMKRKEAASARG